MGDRLTAPIRLRRAVIARGVGEATGGRIVAPHNRGRHGGNTIWAFAGS